MEVANNLGAAPDHAVIDEAVVASWNDVCACEGRPAAFEDRVHGGRSEQQTSEWWQDEIAFHAINRVCIDSPSCHEIQLAGTWAVGVVMAVVVATVVSEPLQSANP